MRTAKRWTNATFTRRVDHEAGAHRGPSAVPGSTTTTEHLAKRLGQALHKALRGAVHYECFHENKFAHVTWSRDR
jgi:hypothetical protein